MAYIVMAYIVVVYIVMAPSYDRWGTRMSGSEWTRRSARSRSSRASMCQQRSSCCERASKAEPANADHLVGTLKGPGKQLAMYNKSTLYSKKITPWRWALLQRHGQPG